MSLRRWIILLVGAVFFLFLDCLVKWYTYEYIPPIRWYAVAYPYGGIPVFQDVLGIDFSLNYVANKGAAWGSFSQYQTYLLAIRILVLIGLIFYVIFARLSFWQRGALSVILTGAMGNVIDYFLYGHVVDLFHFVFWGYSFPVFNVADALIFCGVVVLLWQGLCRKK